MLVPLGTSELEVGSVEFRNLTFRVALDSGNICVWALSVWAALNVMDVLPLSLRSG